MPHHSIRAALPGLIIAACVIAATILLAVCASRASAEQPSTPASATGTLAVTLPPSPDHAGRVGRVQASSGAYCPPGNASLPRDQRLDCSHPEPPCFEDEPCWRWPTMGNRMRGVVTMHGTPLIVTARRFCRLYAHRNLDRYPFNPAAERGDGWLPGDGWVLARCGR